MKKKINCKEIEKLIYLTDDEMDSQDQLVLSQHLESCPSCRELRQKVLATRTLFIELNSVIPIYPDFSISAATLTGAAAPSTLRQKTVKIIRTVSSIAAVLLFALFIGEQAISVQKIASLEKRVKTTVNTPDPGLFDRLAIARSVFTVGEWENLTEGMNINQSISDPADLLRIKNLLETRIRAGLSVNPILQNVNRSSLNRTRNVITYKNLIK